MKKKAVRILFILIFFFVQNHIALSKNLEDVSSSPKIAMLSLEVANMTKLQKQVNVSSIVTDEEEEPLIGVTIQLKGTDMGVATDIDGKYTLNNINENGILIFSNIGFQTPEVSIKGRNKVNVTMLSDVKALDELVIVTFDTQKKESVIASVTAVSPSELKVPSSNLTTAFAGRIAGLISYQRTGEPGQDNAQFFIQGVTSFGTGKVNPLILIDGVEMTTEDLARLTTDDIASFSIMKDANATALYGARGANRVVMVTTKSGVKGDVKVSFRAEGSFSSPTETVEFADPVTYMKLHNDAIRTREPGVVLPYSERKINYTERGIDPLYYPATDCQKLLFKNYTFNQRYNLNITGGGEIAQYYVASFCFSR